jgi:hypothetical protein
LSDINKSVHKAADLLQLFLARQHLSETVEHAVHPNMCGHGLAWRQPSGGNRR